MRRVLQFLKDGRMLAILPDVRMRTPGLAIPFLGGTANIGPGMAAFARAAEVPIFPCIVTRQGWARHRVVIHDAIWPDPSLDKNEDVLRMTLQVMAIIETAIRREPGQWFWFNKRWILEPLSQGSRDQSPEVGRPGPGSLDQGPGTRDQGPGTRDQGPTTSGPVN